MRAARRARCVACRAVFDALFVIGEERGRGGPRGISFNVTEINTEKTGQIFGRLIPPLVLPTGVARPVVGEG